MLAHQNLKRNVEKKVDSVDLNASHHILKVTDHGKQGLVAYGFSLNGEEKKVVQMLSLPCIFDDISVIDYKEEDYYHFFVRYLKVKLDGKYGIIKIGYQTLFTNHYKMQSFMDIVEDLSIVDETLIDQRIREKIENCDSLKLVKKMKF